MGEEFLPDDDEDRWALRLSRDDLVRMGMESGLFPRGSNLRDNRGSGAVTTIHWLPSSSEAQPWSNRKTA